MLRELSLFTGSGGGILASLLLGHRIVGAVEMDEYCCKVLEQRQKDGVLDEFPIFQTDIRDFIRKGYADLYKGSCDLISAGFPCQPFSTAGNRGGGGDQRNKWPETIEVIRIVQPRYCFLENVRGLLSSGYFGKILEDLAESGYRVRWRILSAAELGAPHKRDRLWLVAHTTVKGLEGEQWQESEGRGEGLADSSWWEAEPDVGRVVDGMAFRVDRLKALGNGQVPVVAATAWRLLMGI